MERIDISITTLTQRRGLDGIYYLLQGYVKNEGVIEAVYIIQFKSRWGDVGTHNYLFGQAGNFHISYKGSLQGNFSLVKKDRITKKNHAELAEYVSKKLIPTVVV